MNQLIYAGCLASDPFFSLKRCDHMVVSGLADRGVNVRELQKEFPKGRLFRKLNRNLLYPALVAKATKQASRTISHQPSSVLCPQSSCILHISSQCYAHLIPYAKCPVVITCHGLSEHYFPQDMTNAQMRRWYARGRKMQGADLIVAVSEFVKSNLMDLFDIPEEKIVVNYNGVSEVFASEAYPEWSPRFRMLSKFGEDSFYILSVGTNLHVKNMHTLLRAVRKLRTQGLPAVLVKAGDDLHQTHGKMIRELRLEDVVVDMGSATELELKELYNRCDALVFPSFYEGFGLPVVEAQRCGLPCVVSSIGSLAEVGGDAALYHNPADGDHLATQLSRVCRGRELQESMIAGGLRHSKRFSWDRHVEALIDGWKRLI